MGIMRDKIPSPFSRSQDNSRTHNRPGRTSWLLSLLVCLALYSLLSQHAIVSIRFSPPTLPFFLRNLQSGPSIPLRPLSPHLRPFQDCAICNFLGTGLPFLAHAEAIPQGEFAERRRRLAEALVRDRVDAFVVEPGYTMKYYANVSQVEWEVWEPEERPFLMVVKPTRDPSTGAVEAATSFLVPSFEASRAELLGMPFDGSLDLVPYEEHWDPYTTLLTSRVFNNSAASSPATLMVDEEMRDFIQRGLGAAGFDVVGLGGEVEKVRQRKTKREVGILRAVNEGTVVAVREMRKCLTPGLTENEVAAVLDNTLRAGGLEPFFDIVEFGEDAALPHGGADGTRKLRADDFVLIDVGAHLYGYSSDICRTFFPPFFPKPVSKGDVEGLSPKVRKMIEVWNVVMDAQTASIVAFVENATAASVDIAARSVIEQAGYGEGFTHRVGHGIGIKAHESPYLNKGNVNTTLKAGMTFTSEPGVYIWDEFGVRHEDIFLVAEDGAPELLTGRRAESPWEP